MKRLIKGFTLIELLIVVAIIAILAAIAVPNFLEAQTRSKVSRTKADMRSASTAMESYAVDNNAYPLCHTFGIAGSEFGWDPTNPSPTSQNAGILEHLSTPVAYMTQALVRDPFSVMFRYSASTAAALAASTKVSVPGTDAAGRLNSYIYQSWDGNDRRLVPGGITTPPARAWLLHSAGPDSAYHNLGGVLAQDYVIDGPILLMYDPTNGTISFGSIYRTGGNFYGNTTGYAAGSGLQAATQRSLK